MLVGRVLKAIFFEIWIVLSSIAIIKVTLIPTYYTVITKLKVATDKNHTKLFTRQTIQVNFPDILTFCGGFLLQGHSYSSVLYAINC